MTNTITVTASTASKTHVSSLPPQLLALVLAHVEPTERLGTMARVCSAWRAAAVIATNSISACGSMWGSARKGIRPSDIAALSGWLQAHAAAAALDSLAVQGVRWQDHTVLHLPVQQLASLRSLDLDRVKVAVQGGADTQTAVPDLPPELSGLTRLRLWRADVGLSTLPAFTNLRHLALAHHWAHSRSLELSGLLQLTHLHLSEGYAQDDVLGPLPSFTCLRELVVEGHDYTADGLAALPASLTKLCFTWSLRVTLAPDSTPAVAQLTALQWLEVNNAAGFSTAVLCSMSSLRHLAVLNTLLLQAGDGDSEDADESDDEEARDVDLSVFSRLTQLQHLELPGRSSRHAAAGTDAEVSALTASSQLTCLNIERLVEQEHYRKIFPEGRRLPQLQELRASMGLLGGCDDVEAMVQCCPNLERLEVTAAMRGEPVLDDFPGDEHDWCSVAVLGSLHSLTRLAINVAGEDVQDSFECGEVFWRSMADLTSLRDLYINDLCMEQFGGIVELTSCRQLTHLKTDDASGWREDFEMETAEGQPPDVWRRLPQEALQAALQYYKDNLDYPQNALRSLAWAAAQHALELDREVRREVGELRATVAGLESRLQQQDERLQLQDEQRQEVADLQATVAAMGAQLQALLLQNNAQQG